MPTQQNTPEHKSLISKTGWRMFLLVASSLVAGRFIEKIIDHAEVWNTDLRFFAWVAVVAVCVGIGTWSGLPLYKSLKESGKNKETHWV